MQRIKFASIILVLSLAVCSCSTTKENSNTNDVADDLPRLADIANEHIQPSISDELAMTSTEWPNIDNAKVTHLELVEELISRVEGPKSYDYASVNISTRFDKDDFRTYVSINNEQRFHCDALCEMRCGIADINNDGTDDLLIFIWAGLPYGDFHAFSIDEDMEEILTFSGRNGSDVKQLPNTTYINIPNNFKNPLVPTYKELCIDVEILTDGDKNFLRFVHDRNSDESAFSYVIWDNEWTVIKQEIVKH